METNNPFNRGIPKNENEPDLIEEMEKKLYSRKDEIQQKERTRLNPKKFGFKEEWEDGEDLSFKKKPEESHASGYVKFFLFSFLFFLVAAGIAGYSFLSKRGTVSPDNVTVSLFGPVSLKGGEELSLQVLIENKNDVPLHDIDVTVNFPKGAYYSNNSGKVLSRYVVTIPSISANEIRTETVKAIFFGEENQQKSLATDVKFQIEGLGSSYKKNKTFSFNLTSSPLSLTTDVLKEAISGQEIKLGVSVKSLSSTPVKSPLIEVTYPKGFVFKSASPSPAYDDNVWALGDFAFGDEKHIEITGTIAGENDQEKVFNISAGVPGAKDETVIESKLAALSQSIFIKKPFLGVGLFLNGSASSEYILSDRNNVNVSAQWMNNLAGKITDGQITVALIGDMVDFRKVTVKDNGFYDISLGTVLWDSRTTSSLASIEAGGGSTASLTFNLLPFTKKDGTVFKNPEITVRASVKGKRISEKNVPEEISSFVESKIKVGTSAKFTPSLLFHSGPFTNSGPLPLTLGQETTATVVWKVSNSVNNVSGARVTAVLPRYVRWAGNIAPEGSPVSYNSVSGEVSWNIGTLKAGAGYESEPKEIAFQIGVTPGYSQVGESPTLVLPGVFTGRDDFTGLSFNQDTPSSDSYSFGDSVSRDMLKVKE